MTADLVLVQALYVDDDSGDREECSENIQLALEELGLSLRFEMAGSPEEAKKLLPAGQDTFQIIFVDMMYRNSAGAIRNRGKEILSQARKTQGVVVVGISSGDSEWPHMKDVLLRDGSVDIFWHKQALIDIDTRSGVQGWDSIAAEIFTVLTVDDKANRPHQEGELGHLEHDSLLNAQKKMLEVGLASKRSLLLGGLPLSYVASLPIKESPADQLTSDLTVMNVAGATLGGVHPLERTLRNASHQLASRPDLQTYFRDLADDVAGSRPADPDSDGLGMRLAIVEERILHSDDKLAIGFVHAAAHASRSVVRLTVPSLRNGIADEFPFSNTEMRFYGTGWLLTESLLITNHHVINARAQGEPDSSSADFQLQAESTVVEFDYDSEGSHATVIPVQELAASDKELDYAILRLSEDSGRRRLDLFIDPLELSDDAPVPVNIIQHPSGGPKQIALRNNLAARLTGDELAYFTDTEGGSSGAPVCGDDWLVRALHKASSKALGPLDLQGKTTAWVNIGTRIDVLVEHWQTHHPELWAEIGGSTP